MRAVVKLRAGHVQPVWTGHPWVFAQAIASVDGSPSAGDEVDVTDPRGSLLGRGLWSPGSSVPVRIYTRRDEPVDDRLFADRIEAAVALRRDVLGLPADQTTGYRLVHAEGDGLPGLIVDVYDRVVAVQALTIGIERHLDAIVDAIVERLGARTVIAAPAPARIAEREGLTDRSERALRGALDGPPTFLERGLRLTAQVGGQKTGYYLDQRENRALVESFARGRRVLDLFTFTGGFALAAARGGAREIVAVDSSLVALEHAAEHAVANGLAESIRFHRGDVRKNLGGLPDREAFDLVILDPPKLAESRRDLASALRLYRHLNAMALRRLAPGGLFLTCSCSQLVSGADLVRTVSLAARDAGRTAAIVRTASQGPDHPVPLAFPEGRYLKVLLLHVP